VRPSQSKPDRGIVKVRTDVFNQRNELVATFKRAVLIPKRPA
jgi:acyl dehydratase